MDGLGSVLSREEMVVCNVQIREKLRDSHWPLHEVERSSYPVRRKLW